MNKIIITSLVSGLCVSLGASAADISAKIQSVSANKSKVLIQSQNLERISTGDILTLNDDCSLEVVKKLKDKAVLSAELCENSSSLVKGKVVSLSTDEANPTAETFNSRNVEASSASNNSTSTKSYRPVVHDRTKASEGFRIEFIKSFLDGKVKAIDSDGFSDSAAGEMDHDFGIGIGYANIGINSPGFLGSMIFTQLNNEAHSVRLAANGTYGINETVYFLGGMNLHKFTKGAKELDLGVGFQAGAGVQLNQNFGLNLQYVTLNNDGNFQGAEVDLEAKGLELSLHGTF